MLSPYVCITEMIEHMVRECTEFYKGGKHKDDWVFYHDDLSPMTPNETVKWMKEKDFYKRWLLPANGLHLDDEELKIYAKKPLATVPK